MGPGNFEQFLHFFEKMTPYGKIFKIFTALPIDVVVFKFCEMLLTGNW